MNATSNYSQITGGDMPHSTSTLHRLHPIVVTRCRVVRKSARCQACWRTCQCSFAAAAGMLKFAGARCSEMRQVVAGRAPSVFSADCGMVSACLATPRSTSEHRVSLSRRSRTLGLTEVGRARLAPQGNQGGSLGLGCNLSRIRLALAMA